MAIGSGLLAIVHGIAIGRSDLAVAAALRNVAWVLVWALATPFLFRACAMYPLDSPGRGARYAAAFAMFFIATNAIERAPLAIGHDWRWFIREMVTALTFLAVPASLAFAILVAIGHRLALKRALTHLAIADRGSTHRVPVETIRWIEAEDNYVLIHTPERTYTARERISDFESKLDASRFARVHRSAIVNITRVTQVRPLSHGDYEVVLDCGTGVRGSRSRRHVLARLR